MNNNDEADFFQTGMGLILEQVLQKLLRALPSNQVKLAAPGALFVKSFLEAIDNDNHDALCLTSGTQRQIAHLTTIFKSAEDKTILPTAIIEAVQAVQKPAEEERLFLAMKNLNQGGQLLKEAASCAEKRMASDVSLAELSAEVTTYVEKHVLVR